MNSADRQISEALQGVAEGLDQVLSGMAGQSVGFCLFVFPTADTGRASYISNCDREEVRAAIQKCLDHWAAGMPDIPAHEVLQ